LLWEQTKDKKILPPHVLLMSRAHQSNGKMRERYYALVCESPSGIPHTGGGVLNSGSLRNFGDSGRSIGSSQITAVAEQTGRTANGRSYPITFRAKLVPPYVVQITAPRLLSADERRLLDEVSRDGKRTEDWIAVAKRLRRN
jgi:hypothetical protein